MKKMKCQQRETIEKSKQKSGAQNIITEIENLPKRAKG